MRRDVRTVLHGGSLDWIQSLADSVIVLMIEKREAVENLEAILSVKGVDMVQFGPSDYSMSIGVTRQTAGERVREAERYVIETAHRLIRTVPQWKQLATRLRLRGKPGSVAAAAVANRWIRKLYHQMKEQAA